MSYLTLTITLLLIINPLGNAKKFLQHLDLIPPSRQKKVVLRELLYSLALMLIFSVLGTSVFDLLSISKTTAYMTSGLILFLTAIKILFPKEEYEASHHAEAPHFVPMTIPLIVSPALLATIMLYASTEATRMPMNIAIFIAWLLASIIYISIRTMQRVVGQSGLLAFERLMGMVLVLLSVQRFMEGLLIFSGKAL